MFALGGHRTQRPSVWRREALTATSPSHVYFAPTIFFLTIPKNERHPTVAIEIV